MPLVWINGIMLFLEKLPDWRLHVRDPFTTEVSCHWPVGPLEQPPCESRAWSRPCMSLLLRFSEYLGSGEVLGLFELHVESLYPSSPICEMPFYTHLFGPLLNKLPFTKYMKEDRMRDSLRFLGSVYFILHKHRRENRGVVSPSTLSCIIRLKSRRQKGQRITSH